MNVRPTGKRLIVFTVPRRRKLKGSMLYVPNDARGSMNRAEDVWILATGPNVKQEFHRGDHCVVSDAFELEPTNLKLWDEFKEHKDFKELSSFVDAVDGDVETKLVLEDSLLAVYPEAVEGEFYGGDLTANSRDGSDASDILRSL